MMPPICIRSATEQDLSALIQLDALSNPHPWGKVLVADALMTRQNWLVEVMYADLSKQVLGWLTASILFDQSELELIVIDQAARRQGLARKLMLAWLEAVAQQGVSEYLLDVRESNVGAIGLYESLGFEQVGRRKNYYPADSGHEAACLYSLKMPPPSLSLKKDL